MEKTPWRTIFYGTGASLLLFMVIYLFLAPGDRDFFDKVIPEQATTFQQITITGRENGQPVWYFEARNGYSTKNQDLTILYHVQHGKLLRDGIPVLKNFSAPLVKLYRTSKRLEAAGSVTPNATQENSLLTAQISLKRLSAKITDESQAHFLTLRADSMEHNQNEKISELKGRVIIWGAKYDIRSDKMSIDHNRSYSVLTGNVNVRRKNLIFKCATLEYDSQDEHVVGSGNLTFTLLQGRHRTRALAQRLIAYDDDSREIILEGPVYLMQAKKSVWGKNAQINLTQHILQLTGEVRATFEKGRQFLKPETLKEIDNPVAQEILKEKTQLKCERLLIFTNTENAEAFGNVVIDQKGKEAKSDYAKYNEKSNTLTLTGNVWMKKGTTWVQCKKVIVSVKDEVFTALGQVQSEFKLEK